VGREQPTAYHACDDIFKAELILRQKHYANLRGVLHEGHSEGCYARQRAFGVVLHFG
jgi:hypothetical protein